MSENTYVPTDDILGADLTGIEREAYPVLEPGSYLCKIVECKTDKTKDGKGQVLVVTFATEGNAKSVEGKDVPIGYKITHRVGLTPTEKYPIKRVLEGLAEIRQGCFGLTAQGSFGDPAQYIGQAVTIKTKVEKDKDGKYADRTGVSKILPKS